VTFWPNPDFPELLFFGVLFFVESKLLMDELIIFPGQCTLDYLLAGEG
jgi:hypothetical protein